MAYSHLSIDLYYIKIKMAFGGAIAVCKLELTITATEKCVTDYLNRSSKTEGRLNFRCVLS